MGVWFSNGQALALAIVLTIWNPTIQNLDVFVLISNGFKQNGGHLSWFQMVGLPDSHSKSGPFATQPLFEHSKSRLVRFQIPTIFWEEKGLSNQFMSHVGTILIQPFLWDKPDQHTPAVQYDWAASTGSCAVDQSSGKWLQSTSCRSFCSDPPAKIVNLM